MANASTAVYPTYRSTASTWIGLGIALFALPVIRQIFRWINPTPGTGLLTARELTMFASAVVLLVIVRRWEKLPLTSVGLGTSAWWKSILWGLGAAVLCGGVAIVLVELTGYGHGAASATFDRSPLWLVTMIVFRAGLAEELFYRAYAFERLLGMGWGKLTAAAVPLLIFAAGHYTGGPANILIALVIGGILAGLYVWRRDVVACMFAHTLVDFVTNVLPRLAS